MIRKCEDQCKAAVHKTADALYSNLDSNLADYSDALSTSALAHCALYECTVDCALCTSALCTAAQKSKSAPSSPSLLASTTTASLSDQKYTFEILGNIVQSKNSLSDQK